jgi:glycolate oxidase FAD binding subunit
MTVASSASTVSIRAFKVAAHNVVTPDHVHSAQPSDIAANVSPEVIVEPGTEQELAQVLKIADDSRIAVIPRGGGTKLAWGNPPLRLDAIVSTSRLNRIIEHAWADLTVSVEAGCTVQKLQDALALHNQRLALDPLWPERATIGGVLSTNDTGTLRLRFGGLRDLIIGATLALPDGTLASSGGKVVKNVAGYDLPKLATGAFGTLGVITRAVFRLHPLPQNSLSLTILASDLHEIQRMILAIQSSKLAHAALQVRVWAEAPPEVNILFEGTEAGIAAQRADLAKLVGTAKMKETSPDVWKVRQELWPLSSGSAMQTGFPSSAIAKISILPSTIAMTVQRFADAATPQHFGWRAVIQATGIGWVRLDGQPYAVHQVLQALRTDLEAAGGSLVVLEHSEDLAPFDAWGNPGHALPVMRALKQQFDPLGTLNAGRFVGGI